MPSARVSTRNGRDVISFYTVGGDQDECLDEIGSHAMDADLLRRMDGGFCFSGANGRVREQTGQPEPAGQDILCSQAHSADALPVAHEAIGPSC